MIFHHSKNMEIAHLKQRERCGSNSWGEKSAVSFFLPHVSHNVSDVSKADIVSEDTSFPTAQKRGSAQASDDSGSRVMWASSSSSAQSVPSSSPLSSALCILPLSPLNGCPVICRSIWPIQRLSCIDLRPAGKDNCARSQQRCYICLGAPLE